MEGQVGTERSDQAYFEWRRASDKFDYFMVGLAGALTAYVGQNLEVGRFALDANTFQLLSAISFLGTVVTGLQRIEGNVTHASFMHQRLYHEEAAGATMKALMAGTTLNEATGDILTPGQAAQKRKNHQHAVSLLRGALDLASEDSTRLYNARNRLLWIGFILLMVGKVLPAYLQGNP